MLNRRMSISEVPSDLIRLQQLKILDLSQNAIQLVPEVILFFLITKPPFCTGTLMYDYLKVTILNLICWHKKLLQRVFADNLILCCLYTKPQVYISN